MKAMILVLTATLTLAACGVGGPPVRPTAYGEVTPGVSVSGDAIIGVRTNDL